MLNSELIRKMRLFTLYILSGQSDSPEAEREFQYLALKCKFNPEIMFSKIQPYANQIAIVHKISIEIILNNLYEKIIDRLIDILIKYLIGDHVDAQYDQFVYDFIINRNKLNDIKAQFKIATDQNISGAFDGIIEAIISEPINRVLAKLPNSPRSNLAP